MSEYKMEINGQLELEDYSSIHDYIGIVGEKDKVTIYMKEDDVENINIVNTILQVENFRVIREGGNECGKIHITAFRKDQR